MYDYPERKQYRYIIPTTKGKFVLKFQQATAEETKDFYNLIEQIQK
jgi:hypothetical protein